MSNEEELRKIVISNWQEKLLRFQIEESITNDTGKKFELAKRIEECKQKIAEIAWGAHIKQASHGATRQSKKASLLKSILPQRIFHRR